METTRYQNAQPKLWPSVSVQRLITPDATGVVPNADRTEAPAAAPVTLGLSIRRARLIAFTAVMMVVIVGLVVFFRHGVALTHFDSREKNATQQTKLLDDYNSYSGNIATIFATPIELFVTVAVQVIMLRFMASMFTRPDVGWKISVLTLLAGAGIGYLIGNGFNALNVQLRAQEIQPAIVKEDLTYVYDFSWSNNRTTYDNYYVSEATDRNLLLNTLLRQAIMPKALRIGPNCTTMAKDIETAQNASNTSIVSLEESFIGLGFMQRDWFGRLLQEAPPSNKMRVIVNPSSKIETPTSSELPMNASIAATLFYHGILISTDFFPWGPRNGFANRSDIARRYPVTGSNPQVLQENTAKLYGLLPPSDTDAPAQKAWFLRESMAAMSRQFALSKRTKTSDLVMEFSHTQLTETISFDAVTFEVEIDPALLAAVSTANNKTRYTVLDQRSNCPVSQRCMIPKVPYRVVDGKYDPPAQVFALSTCFNDNAHEELRSNFTRQNTSVFDDQVVCSDPPNGSGDIRVQSMLVVSIGKRLVADGLDQNVSVTSNGTTKSDTSSVTATNLRKIYTFTVGRLAWEYVDIARTFHARCVDDKSRCIGLNVPLTRSLDAVSTLLTEQRLVVRATDLPTYTLASAEIPIGLGKITLLMLDEPPEVRDAPSLYNILAGDVLLPTNAGKISWDPNLGNVVDGCSADVEDRIVQTLDNHYYMEHGLQVGYTTGLYFLLMYGAVKDVIQVSPTKTSLAFNGNSQSIAVWVSIPTQNMWLTLAGCFLLVTGVVAALIKATWFSGKGGDELAQITDPQAVARVMVDDRHYPPLFLRRQVVETDGAGRFDDYAISGLLLRQQSLDVRDNRGKSEATAALV